MGKLGVIRVDFIGNNIVDGIWGEFTMKDLEEITEMLEEIEEHYANKIAVFSVMHSDDYKDTEERTQYSFELKEEQTFEGMQYCEELYVLTEKTEKLQHENTELKKEIEDIMLYSAKLQDGKIDMTMTGERAKIFFATLTQIFIQNGGKNFLTLEARNGSEGYSITIENLNGKESPVSKLKKLIKEKEHMLGLLELCKPYIQEFESIHNPEVEEILTQIDELEAMK